MFMSETNIVCQLFSFLYHFSVTPATMRITIIGVLHSLIFSDLSG